MADFILRPVCPEDYPALTRLWSDCFGDPTGLIEKFFALLPELGRGVAAERGGRAVGAAYALTGLKLALPNGAEKSCGYIYAVAVEENCRGMGMGGALSIAAAEAARAAGAEIICTLPAEESLYGWYERLIGVKYALRRRERCVRAGAGADCLPISAEEYSRRREMLLSGRAHICLPPAYIDFQRSLCTEYGGGLYAICGGVAAAYTEEDCALVRELILPEGADSASAAASLAKRLGAACAVSFEPCPEGEKFIAADSPLPQECLWNLALD